MRLFSEIKRSKVSLFRDKTVLASKHLLEDEEVVDREEEIERIADYIKRVLAEGSFQILFIYGSSGLGKTAITRYVLNKLQTENVEQALPIYVDCIDKNTRHSILSELMRFFRAFYDGKGRGCDEILEDFISQLKRSKQIPIITLDNFDRVSDLEKLLWDLNELSTYVQCGVILISTGKFDLLNHLGNRIRSRLNIEELYFKKYDEETIFKILKARVKSAFSNKVSDKALRLIARYSEEKGGNVKIAFNLLLNAGEIAQWEESNKVEEFHAKEAISKLERIIINDKLREMERKRKNELKVLNQKDTSL